MLHPLFRLLMIMLLQKHRQLPLQQESDFQLRDINIPNGRGPGESSPREFEAVD